MSKPNFDHAKAIAAALEENGITSDPPEKAPNLFWAAQEAFYICQGHRSGRAWRELKERLTGPGIPRAVILRKMADYCRGALRRPLFPEELREAVTYAWGYFDNAAEALTRAEAGMMKSPISID